MSPEIAADNKGAVIVPVWVAQTISRLGREVVGFTPVDVDRVLRLLADPPQPVPPEEARATAEWIKRFPGEYHRATVRGMIGRGGPSPQEFLDSEPLVQPPLPGLG